MALHECEECGGQLGRKAPACPACGSLTQRGRDMRRSDVAYQFVTTLLLAVIAFLLFAGGTLRLAI
jgi:ABC-type ATPase with predicted acetyltransferase domain